jgi:hypothetical protein
VLLGSKLEKHLVARQDSVRFYPLCANCVSRVEIVGVPLPSDDTLFAFLRGVDSEQSSNSGLFVCSSCRSGQRLYAADVDMAQPLQDTF